jgi:small subunit ribosomal protein S8
MKKSVSSMFTKIRNNQGTLQISIKNKDIKICKSILKILICKGFIRGYSLNKNYIEILLKYYKEKPVIFKNIVFNSKHFFISYLSLCKLQKNYELILLSTSRGILTHKEALFYKLGGFIICKIS